MKNLLLLLLLSFGMLTATGENNQQASSDNTKLNVSLSDSIFQKEIICNLYNYGDFLHLPKQLQTVLVKEWNDRFNGICLSVEKHRGLAIYRSNRGDTCCCYYYTDAAGNFHLRIPSILKFLKENYPY